MQTVERVETILSLPKHLLEEANQVYKDVLISDVIESALREYVEKKTPREINRRDIDIINANADKLNREALETLEYVVFASQQVQNPKLKNESSKRNEKF